MNKIKTEKGITLIALIITIVVLLILAVVTIGAVKDGGIIEHAQNAATKYNTAKSTEESLLAEYEAIIDKNILGAIDYDAIAKILTNSLQGQITDKIVVQQLKEQLSINDENVDDMNDMCHLIYSADSTYIYIYKIDELYKVDTSTNSVIYAEKEDYLEQYTYGQNIKGIKTELENIFIGKTESEMLEKYNAEELDDYVLNNSDKITSIEFSSTSTNYIRIANITFINGDNEISLSRNEDNYTMEIYQKEGVYYKVVIAPGT